MKQQQMAQMQQQELVKQTGQLAGTPLMDPSKNPELAEQASQAIQNLSSGNTEEPPQEDPQV